MLKAKEIKQLKHLEDIKNLHNKSIYYFLTALKDSKQDLRQKMAIFASSNQNKT